MLGIFVGASLQNMPHSLVVIAGGKARTAGLYHSSRAYNSACKVFREWIKFIVVWLAEYVGKKG